MSELKLILFLYNHTLLYLGLVLKLEFCRKNMNEGRSKEQGLSIKPQVTRGVTKSYTSSC